MKLTKKAKLRIRSFNQIQQSPKRIKYLLPSLDEHEKALRIDKKVNKERQVRSKNALLRPNA